jgi:hypothetical protein
MDDGSRDSRFAPFFANSGFFYLKVTLTLTLTLSFFYLKVGWFA